MRSGGNAVAGGEGAVRLFDEGGAGRLTEGELRGYLAAVCVRACAYGCFPYGSRYACGFPVWAAMRVWLSWAAPGVFDIFAPACVHVADRAYACGFP